MPPKFGTSGLRGLVTELTDDLVADHIRAFLAACPTGGAVHVGWDLRPSSPRIADVVMETVENEGLPVVDNGPVPTPALALQAMRAGHAAIMVTGSHIPADRNGLKFYVPGGEIAKSDEAGISAALGRAPARRSAPDRRTEDALGPYCARYTAAFGAEALQGWRIGVYQHSSVARDALVTVIEGLGAVAIPLGRSDIFVPVDTEALDPATRAMLRGWVVEHGLDAVVSTDGDADRPMVADATGTLIPGDVLGALTAQALGARIVVTPVSSNTMVQAMGFDRVVTTRIGSPYVIAGMTAALAENDASKVAGYEANGGFLLGFEADGPKGRLAPLMTRDCLLPIVAPLAAARAQGRTLAASVAALPPRFTAADRIAGIDTDVSKAFIARLSADAAARATFFSGLGSEAGIDMTDGMRVTFSSGDVVHLRPSGNAPEFRCYAEADSPARAADLVAACFARVRDELV
ncbi:phosphomannomutase [Thalassococcus sp. CAU 1522]|uniref:Phosphomannomutase n=1 Tax=Thalassococcus arenae TaxID=2851652 RepID=A0ABS6N693_9RHOB|nr:phosphomannomutase [Thalassococcus arenae]MBV2359528.1 phosphomannomutase [Thalassococcus arenae]